MKTIEKGMIVIIYLRLIERIFFKNFSIEEIAEQINLKGSVLKKKLGGLAPLYLDEAEAISNLLDINLPDEKIYFFYPTVPKMGRNGRQEKILCQKRRKNVKENISY